MAELKKVKTAIIGCGQISKIYILNFKNLFSIIDLVALGDINQSAAEEACARFEIAKAMSIDAILADPEIELIVNLTAPAAHYEVIKRCLEAGKHVYSEKMLCFDLSQGRELIELAEQKNLHLGVAPDTFLGAGVQTAIKAIDSGMVGQITSAVACINRNQLLNSELFRFIPKLGGSMPYDVGIYYLTALLAMLGPISKVSGFADVPPHHEGVLINRGNYGESWDFVSSNSMAISMQFKNGALGNFHINGNSINEEQPYIAVYGTEGILFLDNVNQFGAKVRIIRSGGESFVLPHTHGYSGKPVLGDPTGGEIAVYEHRGLGTAEMAWAIRKNRKHRASKEMALHCVEFFEGVTYSSKTGCMYSMTTTFERPAPLPSGYLNTTFGGQMLIDAERSLVD